MVYRKIKRVKIPLLMEFKRVFGNLDVPKSFVVPISPIWNKQFHGQKIGDYVSSLRMMLKKDEHFLDNTDLEVLAKEGFILNSRDHQSYLYLTAFTIFKQKFGHCNMNNNFEINEEGWPAELSGVKIGQVLNGIRNDKLHSKIHDQLISLGYDLSTNTLPVKDIDLFVFESYLRIVGNLRIPVDFVIPFDDLWPTELHGYDLGSHVTKIRSDVERNINGFDKDKVQRLINMGFSTVEREQKDDRILTAFKTHVEQKGSFKKTYIKVPDDDKSWPEETRGLNLQYIVNSIRSVGLHKPIHQNLRDLGVMLDPIHDSGDFDRIRQALAVYKAQHGNVRVPTDFVVSEDDDRYPKFTWGLRLGQRMSSIRYNNAYMDHRQELVDLGVVFQAKDYFDALHDALTAYKTIHNEVLTADLFTVPSDDPRYPKHTWGMVVGNRITNYVRDTQYREKLAEVGYVCEPYPVSPFESVHKALVAYKTVYGSMLVPSKFVIPAGDERFPPDTWEIKLGKDVQRICKGSFAAHKYALEELGFVFQSLEHDFSSFMTALQVYKDMNGDLLVPSYFTVPQGDVNYPENTWDMKLGLHVDHLRAYREDYSQHSDALLEMGFEYEVKQFTFEHVLSALKTYKSIHGDLMVPRSFVVPEGDTRYSDDTWGCALGDKVNYIRRSEIRAERRETLLEMGFVFDPREQYYEVVHSALSAYKAQCGDLLVPMRFVVPENDSSYPRATWGMNLGRIVMNIRTADMHAKHKQDLIAMGFQYRVREVTYRPKGFDAIYLAMQTYKTVYGNLAIADSFVVPVDETFPVEVRGMKLGGIVSNIRCKGAHAQHREKLEQLGFNFEKQPQRVRDFDLVYEALSAYKTVCGDLLVPKRYAVPHEDSRFPRDSWGMPLGSAVQVIRNQGSHKQHRAKLEELGFVFKEIKETMIECV